MSAFGFGGTNFHAVLEEYVPGRHRPPQEARSYPGATIGAGSPTVAPPAAPAVEHGSPATGASATVAR